MPFPATHAPQRPLPPPTGTAPTTGGLVNLNTADQATLETLPGFVGAVAREL